MSNQDSRVFVSHLRRHLPLLCAYFAVALLLSWPLVTVLSTRYAGHPFGDSYEYARMIWSYADAFRSGQSPFFQPLLAYPDGLPAVWLWSVPLQSFPAWLLAFALPLPAAFNLSLLLTLALNGWAAYLLTHHLTKQRGAAWLGGLIFMAYPTFQGQLGAGHSGLLAVWPAVLYVLALLHLRDAPAPGWREQVRVALTFALSGMGSPLLLIYLTLPLTLFVLWPHLTRWWTMRRILLALLAGAALSALIAVPGWQEARGTSDSERQASSIFFSADVLAIVSPSFMNPLFAGLGYPSRVLGVDPFEKLAYVGLVAGGLALWGAWRQRTARRWLVLALVVWVFSLGPFLKFMDNPITLTIGGFQTLIPLPGLLLQSLPPFSASRTPARFNLTLALAVAVMAAYGAAAVGASLDKRRHPAWGRWALLLAVSALIGWEYLFFGGLDGTFPRLPTIPGEVPAAIAALRDRTDVRAIFDIPFAHPLTDKEALFLQTGHQHPILAGHVVRETPVNPAKLTLLEQTLDPALLDAAGVDIIILHREWDDAEGLTEARLRDHFGAPRYEDEAYTVFEVPPYTGATAGFSALPAESDALTAGQDSSLYAPESGWAQVEARLNANGRTVSAALNGERAHEWALNGEQTVTLPLYLPQAGYHTLRLTLVGGCPALTDAAMGCRAAALDDLHISGFVPDEPLQAVFERGIQLRAARVMRGTDGIEVWLAWHFDQPLTVETVRFVHVTDSKGALVAQVDEPPGVLASGGWSEAVKLALPAGVNPQTAQVSVGWYTYPDNIPFTVDGGEAQVTLPG